MINTVNWYLTELPLEIVRILEKDISKFDAYSKESILTDNVKNKEIRDSRNVWIPTSHWVGGWIWYYIQKINSENYRYDLTDIDGGTIQYTMYGEGQYYNSHADTDLSSMYKPVDIPSEDVNIRNDQTILAGESVRKLSFSLQLSDPTDYTGGEVEFFDIKDNSYLAPKQRGTIIVFDSRVKHRVRKVESGMRKSLVGWVIGPRWK